MPLIFERNHLSGTTIFRLENRKPGTVNASNVKKN
jgi:hypothetical protein